jgi:hypothetical protein
MVGLSLLDVGGEKVDEVDLGHDAHDILIV